MDAKDIRNLQEAYLEVYQDIDEANKENKQKKNDAVSKIIQKKLHPSVLPSLTYGRRELKKEEVDIYDIILSHLLDEGYASTEEAAKAIMVNMSEEWREGIVEAYKKLPVDRMIRQTSRKQFKVGQESGHEIAKGEFSPENRKQRTKYAQQTGKMSAVASMHDPQVAQAKSKLKKG